MHQDYSYFQKLLLISSEFQVFSSGISTVPVTMCGPSSASVEVSSSAGQQQHQHDPKLQMMLSQKEDHIKCPQFLPALRSQIFLLTWPKNPTLYHSR